MEKHSLIIHHQNLIETLKEEIVRLSKNQEPALYVTTWEASEIEDCFRQHHDNEYKISFDSALKVINTMIQKEDSTSPWSYGSIMDEADQYKEPTTEGDKLLHVAKDMGVDTSSPAFTNFINYVLGSKDD